MAVNYLGKSKMYKIAKEINTLPETVKLKDCEYRFYRGSEWLRFHDAEYIYEIYVMSHGNFLSIKKFYYDDEIGRRVEESYTILNGWGKREVDIESLLFS